MKQSTLKSFFKAPLSHTGSEVAKCQVADAETASSAAPHYSSITKPVVVLHEGFRAYDNNKSGILINNSHPPKDIVSEQSLEISEYELKRLENIKRNSEFLAQLGILAPAEIAEGKFSENKHRKLQGSANVKRQRILDERTSFSSTRHSARLSAVQSENQLKGIEAVVDNQVCLESEAEIGCDAIPVLYENLDILHEEMASECASFLKYDNSDGELETKVRLHHRACGLRLETETALTTVYQREEILYSALDAVYSLTIHPIYSSFILAAGSGGRVALLKKNSRDVVDKTAISKEIIAADSLHSDTDSANVILSFVGHARWISSAKFISPSSFSSEISSRSMLVITSSDDGTIKLWDFAMTAAGAATVHKEEAEETLSSSDAAAASSACLYSSIQNGVGASNSVSKAFVSDVGLKSSSAVRLSSPPLLAISKTIHSKGIFAMDVHYSSGGIITGSKDKTIVYSKLVDEGRGQCIKQDMNEGMTINGKLAKNIHGNKQLQYSFAHQSSFEYHTGVVKSVCWQRTGDGSGWLFASGGQDKLEGVKDVRVPGNFPSWSIVNAHSTGIHTVRWGPLSSNREKFPKSSSPSSSEYMLMTVSIDGVVKLFDTRCVAESNNNNALHTLTPPRFPSSSLVYKALMQPSFLDATSIVVPWKGSDALHVYDVDTGVLLSRVNMPLGHCPSVVCSNFTESSLQIPSLVSQACFSPLEHPPHGLETAINATPALHPPLELPVVEDCISSTYHRRCSIVTACTPGPVFYSLFPLYDLS